MNKFNEDLEKLIELHDQEMMNKLVERIDKEEVRYGDALSFSELKKLIQEVYGEKYQIKILITHRTL